LLVYLYLHLELMKIVKKHQNNFKRILLIEKLSDLEKKEILFQKLQKNIINAIIKNSGVPKQYFNNQNEN
jgi:hypothetical protein